MGHRVKDSYRQLLDSELNLKVKNLVAEERKLTKEILLYVAEVDKRRLYLRMAYPSLFDYLTKEIGYSVGAAHRRIDAARLIAKLPEVTEKIESGDINLSQISKVQKACRQLKKESGKVVELSVQKQIFTRIENQSAQQTDLILAQEFQMEVKVEERISVQKDESQRLEVTFSKDEMEIIKKAQGLLSNKTGGGLKDTILEMANRVVKASDSRKNRVSEAVNLKSESSKQNFCKEKPTFTSTVEVKRIAANKLISQIVKKQIKQRDQVCQFKDLKTGRVCGATHFLEIDHIEPKYQGGENNKENLRLLCKSHNLFRYQKLL